MALDVGRIRIGIATSDILKKFANPFQSYKTCGRDEDTDYLSKLVKEQNIELLVIGLPLKLDGSESEQTRLTRIFAALLESKITVPIVFQDERLSSVAAEDMLIEAKMRREDRKKVIDKVAATIILQDFLNNNFKGVNKNE